LTDTPRRLPGAGAWRVGGRVLKRIGSDPSWLDWEARVLSSLEQTGFRIQRPHRSLDGSFVVDGWFARDYLPGAHESGRWPEIISVADALHAAFDALPPSLVHPLPGPRRDAWARADRIAWDEDPMPPAPGDADAVLGELLEARRPVRLPEQLIHGDLTGNVLFADGLPPGVIDFSPYWRPAGYAIGVIVADAVVWEGADLRLLDAVVGRTEIGQCLLRAMIFRHVTALLLPGRIPDGVAAERYRSLRRAVLALVDDPH
jgi:uncharacterized protein (TIGR02569 family)